jgi:hypothetical protein
MLGVIVQHSVTGNRSSFVQWPALSYNLEQ